MTETTDPARYGVQYNWRSRTHHVVDYLQHDSWGSWRVVRRFAQHADAQREAERLNRRYERREARGDEAMRREQ
jgi:hypothetical protein